MAEDKSSINYLCSSCNKKPCCTGFSSPFVFSADLEKLKQIGKAGPNYVKDIVIEGIKTRELRKKPGTDTCVFYDEEKKRCTIYHNKPFDCEMFPFDIVWRRNEFYWVVYSCNPDSDWSWSEEHLEKLEADPRFDKIMKDAKLFLWTQYGYVDQSKEPRYKVLRPVNWKPKQTLAPKIQKRS